MAGRGATGASSLTKSSVATSLATASWGWPAFGFGILARTSLPFSIFRENTLLYRPSRSFVISIH
ncbi:hypothetical protein BJX62DRAFT_212104 [Aspergillus germanicus]